MWLYNTPLLDLVERFRARLDDGPHGTSDAVAAIETLLDLIRSSKGRGVMSY